MIVDKKEKRVAIGHTEAEMQTKECKIKHVIASKKQILYGYLIKLKHELIHDTQF